MKKAGGRRESWRTCDEEDRFLIMINLGSSYYARTDYGLHGPRSAMFAAPSLALSGRTDEHGCAPFRCIADLLD